MEFLSIPRQMEPRPSLCVSFHPTTHTRTINSGHSHTICYIVTLISGVMCLCHPGIQDEVKITLDCSQSDFIAYDKMVISLKGGEM